MRNTFQLLAATLLTVTQATAQLKPLVAASAQVPSQAVAVSKLTVAFQPAAINPVIVTGKPQPDFDRQVLDGLRAAQAEAERQAQLSRLAQITPVIAAPIIGPATDDIWYQLRLCEAGNDYARNSGNGYFGAYQFSLSTWNGYHTGYARPDLAPASVQDQVAQELHATSGWSPWPACAHKLGLN